MSYDFIGVQSIEKDELEMLSQDNTIGLLQRLGGDMRGQAMFDIHRLREAIITYEREFGDETVEIGLIRWGDNEDKPPILALVPRRGAERAVVLSPRTHPDWENPDSPMGGSND